MTDENNSDLENKIGDDGTNANKGDNASDLLAQLVGDGRKFRTVEDLAKGKVEADGFVDKLKNENFTLRQLLRENFKAASEESLMEEMRARIDKSNANNKPDEKPVGQPNGVDRKAVAEAVAELRKEEMRATNSALVNRTLAEKFGDKALETVAGLAKSKGIPGEVLKNVAETSPEAFFSMLGIDNNRANANGVNRVGNGKGSVNSEALKSGDDVDPNVRNKAYYDRLQKEMGATKFALNRKLQLEMHKDMQALGDSFFG